MAATPLLPGDAAPYFKVAASNNPSFAFDTVGGRYIVLSFFGSAGTSPGREMVAGFMRHSDQFNDEIACFFGVSADPLDREQARVEQRVPGCRFFWDFERQVAQLYGALDAKGAVVPQTVVIDPMMRILGILKVDEPARHVERVMTLLRAQKSPGEFLGMPSIAPVLVVPRIFEPEFCRSLVGLYEQGGGQESGFMRDVGGKTVGLVDYGHKRRHDHVIEDERTRQACMARIQRRLVPEIKRAFQFEVTRMERYIVACYDASIGGYFRPHRDNTTHGTAHRRFAVTLNLNAEDYEGGELRFPEFGPRRYRAPTGGAVVFSCALLHEATPVTRGKRYAFLPFLYDEAAARMREANNANLGDGVMSYRANEETPD